MSTWHGYLALQNVGLTTTQAKAIWDQFRRLGPGKDRSPARRCHWRAANDSTQIVFEAAFKPANITINRTKERLAAALDVPALEIDHGLQTITPQQHPITLITFSRAGVPCLRIAVFGTLEADWTTSRQAARDYVTANRDQWEDPT